VPIAAPGVKPVGSVSATVTGAVVKPVPAFVAVSVYVPLEPRVIGSGVCDLAMVKSGEVGVKVALENSSPCPSLGVLSGSGVPLALTCAALVIAVLEVTVPTKSSVNVPTGTVGMIQSPVLEVYVPRLGLLETKLKPAGSLSLTVTFCAALGPALVRVIV
jgi:hypothetical protein